MQWQYNYNNIAHLLNVYAASADRDRYTEHFQKALNTRPDNIMIRMPFSPHCFYLWEQRGMVQNVFGNEVILISFNKRWDFIVGAGDLL